MSTSEKSSESALEVGQGKIPSVGLQPLLMEAKPSGRKELPVVISFLHLVFSASSCYHSCSPNSIMNSLQDLFTAAYSPNPPNPYPFPGWQTVSPYGVGFRMQYNPVAMVSPL